MPTPETRADLRQTPVALFTVVHPGSLPYFGAFYGSVRRHAGANDRLVIASDGVSADALEDALGGPLDAELVPEKPDAGPVGVRVDTLLGLCERFQAIALIDSDDMLLAGWTDRVREVLWHADLAACAMTLVDEDGRPSGGAFHAGLAEAEPDGVRRIPPPAEGAPAHDDSSRPLAGLRVDVATGWAQLLARMNVVGFGNAAYRSELLRRALASPPPAVPMLDWFVASRALALGGVLAFDERPGIAYRLHRASGARVRRPFTAEDLASGTTRVLAHYRSLSAATPPDPPAVLMDELALAQKEVERFQAIVIRDRDRTRSYLDALNGDDTVYRWWEWIACRRFEQLWTS